MPSILRPLGGVERTEAQILPWAFYMQRMTWLMLCSAVAAVFRGARGREGKTMTQVAFGYFSTYFPADSNCDENLYESSESYTQKWHTGRYTRTQIPPTQIHHWLLLYPCCDAYTEIFSIFSPEVESVRQFGLCWHTNKDKKRARRRTATIAGS